MVVIAAVGAAEGSGVVGTLFGCVGWGVVGRTLGRMDGVREGRCEGIKVGRALGRTVGSMDGWMVVGALEGDIVTVGSAVVVGDVVGALLGALLGVILGWTEGALLGEEGFAIQAPTFNPANVQLTFNGQDFIT